MRVRFIAIAVLLLVLLGVPVVAEGNEWVYDEAGVVSEETEAYIKNLNEEAFSSYDIHPQLAVMVINDLPEGYTIDEYKFEMFNEFGVGTQEENCGMLFVFVINDRKYGFEC